MDDDSKVGEMDVRTEQNDSGWVVVADIDGERKQFGDAHPSKEEADLYATHMFASADRWADAGEKVAPDPEKYPGDDGTPASNG